MPATRKADSYPRALALAIRELRAQHGVSQETLALDAGINRSHMGRIERGIANPKFETFVKICQYFDISFGELASRIDDNLRRRRGDLWKSP